MVAVRLLENSSNLIEATLNGASLTTNGENVIYVNTISPTPTITISTDDITNKRFPIYIKDTNGNIGQSNPLTIDCQGGQTIDNQLTYLMDESYGAITLSTNGTNCFIVSTINPATNSPFIPFEKAIPVSVVVATDVVRIITSLVDFSLYYDAVDKLIGIFNHHASSTLRANYNLLYHADQKAPILITPTPPPPGVPIPSYLSIAPLTSALLTESGNPDDEIELSANNTAYRTILDVTADTTSNSGIHLEFTAFSSWSGITVNGWYKPIELPE